MTLQTFGLAVLFFLIAATVVMAGYAALFVAPVDRAQLPRGVRAFRAFAWGVVAFACGVTALALLGLAVGFGVEVARRALGAGG